MTTPNTAVVKTDNSERNIEFVPFGAVDKIKLSIAIVKSIICVPTKTGKVCTDRDAMRFIMLNQAQRLNPFAGDSFLVGYDNQKTGQAVFSLITAHQAFLKRAETCAEFEGLESGIILYDEESGVVTEREGDFKLKKEICVGGWARVHRKGRKPTYRRLSIAAMVPPYETPFWSDDKAPGQIVKCAEADALRSTFPTLIGGLHIAAEFETTASINAPLPEMILSDPPEKRLTESGAVETPEQQAARVDSERRSTMTPQVELESITTAAGFTFADVIAFGKATNNIENADELKSFVHLPTDVCKRFIVAKKQFLAGLAKIKEAA